MVGEMAPWLRVQTALAGGLSSSPNIYTVSHSHLFQFQEINGPLLASVLSFTQINSLLIILITK